MIDAMKNQQKPTTIVLGAGGYVILYILKVGKRRALVTHKIPIRVTELSCGSVWGSIGDNSRRERHPDR